MQNHVNCSDLRPQLHRRKLWTLNTFEASEKLLLGLSAASRSARAASAAPSAALAALLMSFKMVACAAMFKAILESYCNTTEMQPPMMSEVPKAVNAVPTKQRLTSLSF